MSQRTSFLAKPPAGTPINCSDPICHRLKAFIPFWGAYELNQPLRRVEDVVRRVRATPSSVNCLSGPWGIAADISPSDEGIVFPAVSATPAAECYMLAFRTNTSAISYGLLGLGAFGGIAYYQGNGKLQFRRGTFNYAYFNSWPGYCDGLPHVLIVQVPGGAAGDIALAEAYVDGVPLSIWSTLTSGAPGTITSFVVGQTTMGTFPGTLHAVAMWSRTLKAGEIARLSADPFTLLRPWHWTRRGDLAGYAVIPGYRLYLGKRLPENIDWDSPIARVGPGSAQAAIAGLGLERDVDWHLGIRATSSRCVEETGQEAAPPRVCHVRIAADGSLAGPAPNAVESARITPIAAGRMQLDFRYAARDQAAAPAALQVVELDAAGGTHDWTPLIATIAITGSTRGCVTLSPTWAHGQSVRLAARVLSADAVPGPVTFLDAAVADAESPPSISYLEVSQEEL